MMVVGSIGFLVLENLETLHGDHPLAGLSPTDWMIDPGVLASMALVCAAIAAIVTVVTAPRPASYAAVLTSSYADLVATGVYDAAFQHADWATTFFTETLRGPLATFETRRPLRVLEAGVGTGFWLGKLPARVADPSTVELRGFDLSAEMVGAAEQRLAAAGIAAELAVGDILDDDAYVFPPVIRHDVVFAYDVVQQLPRELQDGAVRQLYRHVADGGWLVIFDHDAASRYGRTMGLKKWLRRHLGIPLVPYHYIHSRYPSMAHLRRLLQGAGAADIAIAGRGRGPAPRDPREAFGRPVLGSSRSPRARSSAIPLPTSTAMAATAVFFFFFFKKKNSTPRLPSALPRMITVGSSPSSRTSAGLPDCLHGKKRCLRKAHAAGAGTAQRWGGLRSAAGLG